MDAFRSRFFNQQLFKTLHSASQKGGGIIAINRSKEIFNYNLFYLLRTYCNAGNSSDEPAVLILTSTNMINERIEEYKLFDKAKNSSNLNISYIRSMQGNHQENYAKSALEEWDDEGGVMIMGINDYANIVNGPYRILQGANSKAYPTVKANKITKHRENLETVRSLRDILLWRADFVVVEPIEALSKNSRGILNALRDNEASIRFVLGTFKSMENVDFSAFSNAVEFTKVEVCLPYELGGMAYSKLKQIWCKDYVKIVDNRDETATRKHINTLLDFLKPIIFGTLEISSFYISEDEARRRRIEEGLNKLMLPQEMIQGYYDLTGASTATQLKISEVMDFGTKLHVRAPVCESEDWGEGITSLGSQLLGLGDVWNEDSDEDSDEIMTGYSDESSDEDMDDYPDAMTIPMKIWTNIGRV